MKIRNLLAVLAALVIVGGIYVFAVSRPDDARGAITVWYVEGGTMSDEFVSLAAGYNKSISRASLPVQCVPFADEDAMAAAFDTQAPDLVLCSHYRAFDMHARGKLTDISAALGDSAPDYPRALSSRSACIGASYFPVGAEVQVLFVNTALTAGRDLTTLEALSAAAEEYRSETGKPFYAAADYAPLFFTEYLREGEEFDAGSAARSSKVYKHIYNLLAENAYTGALSLSAVDEVSAVSDGELGCAVVGTTALPKKLGRGVSVLPVPPLTAAGGEGELGEAWGLAVVARGSRSTGDISAFLAWLFSSNRDTRLALQTQLVPARTSSLITRDALWSALIALNTGEIVALPPADSDFAANRADFERDIRARLAFLAQ